MIRRIAMMCICGLLVGCSNQAEVSQPEPPADTDEPADVVEPAHDEPAVPAEPPAEPTKPTKACVATGCSSTVCVEEGNEVMTTCIYKPEFECYKSATCERQASGECGWTQTDELRACLEQARAQEQ